MGACYNCTRSTYYVQCPSRTSVTAAFVSICRTRVLRDAYYLHILRLPVPRGPCSKALSSNGFGFCALVLRYFWFMGVFRCLIRSAIGTITLVRHSSWCETHGSVSLQRPSAESFYGEKSSCPHSRPRGYEIRSPPHRVLSLCGRRARPGARPADRTPRWPGPTDPHLPPAPLKLRTTTRPVPVAVRGPRRRLGEVRRLRRRSTVWLVGGCAPPRARARAAPPARCNSRARVPDLIRALPAHTLEQSMRFLRKSSTSRRS